MPVTNTAANLEQALNHAATSTERVDALNDLAWQYRTRNPKQSYQYAKESLQIAKEINYALGEAYAKMFIAFYYYFGINSSLEAIALVKEAELTFQTLHDKSGLAWAYMFSGINNFIIGNFDDAFMLLTQGYQLGVESGNKEAEAWNMYNLGSFYAEMRDYEVAIECHIKALEAFMQVEDEQIGVASCLTGLGSLYLAVGYYDLAWEYLFRSLGFSRQIEDDLSIARALNEIGVVCESLQRYDDALQYLQQSLEIRVKNKAVQGIITTYYNLANTYQKTEKYTQAINALSEALTLANEVNAKPKILRIYQLLAQIYKKTNEPYIALEVYEKYIELKTELIGEESNIKLQNIKALYSVEKAQKEAEIERLRNEELKKAYTQIEAQTKSIIDSINYAKRIQDAILPPASQIQRYADTSFIFYQPKDIVSGDFYWFGEIVERMPATTPYSKEIEVINKFILAAIDCTGHGVPGAFMTMMANSLLNEIVYEAKVIIPSEILYLLDQKVRLLLHQDLLSQDDDSTHDGMDVSIVLVDYETNNLYYAGAKNAMYLVQKGEIIEYKSSKYPIGSSQYKIAKSFELHTIPMKPSTAFYLFTDGFQDQFGGEQNTKYLKKRFRELLLEISPLSTTQQKQKIEQEFITWKGKNNQTDDVLVIGVQL